MDDQLSERRLAENEVYFRQMNESVQKGFDELKQMAKEDNQEHLITEHDTPLNFYCECSNEDCKQRIPLTLDEYKAAHKNSDTFIVTPGHEITNIEKVIAKEQNYMIVEKYIHTPSVATKLNKT
jgi:hypothetical protein